MNRISLYALGATAIIATAACTPAQAGPIDTSDKEAMATIAGHGGAIGADTESAITQSSNPCAFTRL